MAGTDTSTDPSLLKSLKYHLEGLKRTEHGLILYNQIQRGLQKYGHEDGRIELVFVTFLHGLLGKYATSPACDPATRVKARLIQQRLTLYLPTPSTAPTTAPAAAAPCVPAGRGKAGRVTTHRTGTDTGATRTTGGHGQAGAGDGSSRSRPRPCPRNIPVAHAAGEDRGAGRHARG